MRDNGKLWIAGGVVAALVLVGATWFLLIGPARSDTKSLRNQQAAAELKNAQLHSQLVTLKKKSSQIDTLRAQLQAAVDGLPGDSSVAAFTREVSTLAATSGVTVGSITIGNMVPYSSAVSGRAPSTATGKLESSSITITSYGAATNQFAFVSALQTGARRTLVQSTQMSPGTSSVVASIDPSSTLTTVLSVFEAPTTPAEQAQLDKLLAGTGAK